MKSRKLSSLFAIVILISCVGLFLTDCRRPDPELVPGGEIDILGFTEDGNVIVTPAFILDYKRLKKVEEKCKEKLEEKGG